MKRKAPAITLLTLLLTATFAAILDPSAVRATREDVTSQPPLQLADAEFSPPATEWAKTYGGTNFDWAECVIQTSDGGYAITGDTSSFGAGGKDFWLVKTDVNGDAQWNKTYGGTGDDVACSVVQTVDGGYAIVGYTNSSGAGNYDFWLVKTDQSGNMQWSKTYGGGGDERATSVVQTSDGGYAIAGGPYYYNAGEDFLLLKTDQSGNMQWNKTYGGISFDEAHSVIQTSDGGYAIIGSKYVYTIPGNWDFWLVKTNSNGDKQWDKTYGGTSAEFAHSVVQATDGGYALGGYTASYGAGNYDFWLVKTDQSGNMQWNNAYGGEHYEEAFSVVQTRDGGYALGGWTMSYGAGNHDFWLVKTDPSGNEQWSKTCGGGNTDHGRSMIQTSDGGYALAGYTPSYGAGLGDFWLVKVAASKPTVRSGWLSFYVTFDGKMTTEEEWSDTIPVDLNLTEWYVGPGTQAEGDIPAKIWVKNDDTWLYMLYRVEWPAVDIDPSDGGFIEYFWNWIGTNGDLWEHSDLGYVAFNNATWDSYGWNETTWFSDTEALPPGENNVQGAATHDGTYYWFEFRKKLESGDGYDWSFEPGQIIEPVFEPTPESHLLVSLWDNSTSTPYSEYIALQLAGSQDVLIIDDTRKYAYFGWYRPSEIPSSEGGQSSSEGWETTTLPNMTRTTIYVDPSVVDEDSPPLQIDHRFNVTVRVDNVTDLLEWGVQICYNSTILNATGAWMPKWDPEYVFYNRTSYDVLPEFGFDCVWLTDSLYLTGEPTFEGNGTLAIIEFAVKTLPAESCYLVSALSINNTYTSLWNSDIIEIPTDKIDGLYRSFGKPPVGWNLLRRTMTWAIGDTLPNETNIVLFTRDGSLSPQLDPNGKAVYDKLIYWGYNGTNISVFYASGITDLPSGYYDSFHLVIYASADDYDSTNVLDSSIPFITFAPGQTDEMEIGTGTTTAHAYQNNFYVVNNNYYPTNNYPTGLLLFENEISFKATQATGSAKVLVKAEQLSVVSEVKLSLVQDVYVSSDGSANMSFIMTAHSSSPSPLADGYREAFFTEPPPYEPEVEYEIPENKTVEQSVEVEEGVKDLSLVGDVTGPEGVPDGKVDIRDIANIAKLFGVNFPDPKYNLDYDIVYDAKIDIKDIATAAKNYGKTTQQSGSQLLGVQQTDGSSPESLEPVRELFYAGIMIEQSVLLGFDMNITESKIVPWGANNETRLLVSTYCPQIALPLDSSSWRIYIGPQDDNSTQAASEFMMTKIQQIQLIMRSWGGEQTLQYNWTMNVHLPAEAELLNLGELLGLNWTIDFGGGTFMEALVAPNLQGVTVNETMLVTEQDITASDTYLNEAFSEYKVFRIDYSSPVSLNQATSAQECGAFEDFWYDWWITVRLPCSKTFSYGPLKATLRVTPQLKLHGYIGWHFKWWKLRWFDTGMVIEPSITAEAIATATASYSKTWSYTLLTMSYRFSFWVGAWPVWANLKFTITAGVTVNAKAQASVTASVSLGTYLHPGVKWNRDSGWSTFVYNYPWATLSGPSISASASLTVTPWAAARVAFLIYDVAGPFAEAKLSAPMTITLAYPSTRRWSISIEFTISAGVGFAGWLKDLLKLSDYSRVLYRTTLASWSGDW